MDSRNSSDIDGNSLQSASVKDAETLAGQSIFDEPDCVAGQMVVISNLDQFKINALVFCPVNALLPDVVSCIDC